MNNVYHHRFLPDSNNHLWCRLIDRTHDSYLKIDYERQVNGYAPIVNVPSMTTVKTCLNSLTGFLMIGVNGSVTYVSNYSNFSDNCIEQLDLPSVKDVIIQPNVHRDYIVLLTLEGIVLRGDACPINAVNRDLEVIATDIAFISIEDGMLLTVDINGKVTWDEFSCQLPSPIRIFGGRVMVLENEGLVIIDIDQQHNLAPIAIPNPLGRITSLVLDYKLTVMDDQGVIADFNNCYTRVGEPDHNGVYHVIRGYRLESSRRIAGIIEFQRLVKIDDSVYIEDVNGLLHHRKNDTTLNLPFHLNRH